MKPTRRGILTYVVVVILTILVGACGGDDDTTAPSGADESTPVVEESVPLTTEETVPLEDAKKGDLIALPFYPGAGRYGGTKDVRGLETYAMKMAIVDNIHLFGPSVLIGSPGQKIKLTSFEDQARGGLGGIHDFRISDTPEFSIDHEIVGEQWKSQKGTEFTLTFPEEGSVAFYCSYHLRINMAGMLIVKDSM